MPEPVLELEGLEVRYGTVAAVRDVSPAGRQGRDRRADRPERRRQVDDAARDHGRRPAARRRDPAARALAARPLAGVDRPARASRSCPRAGGSSPTSRSRRTCASGSPRAASATARDPLAPRVRPLPDAEGVPPPAGGRALGRPAAAARDRPGARGRARTCCSSTSRRSASRRLRSTSVFEALRGIRERGVTILLVEQRALHTVALADRTHVLVGGELRLTLDPGRRERHRQDRRRLPRLMILAALDFQTLSDAVGLGRDLRADGRRDRARLRRAAARQLRLRPAGDGRRVHARLHLELAACRRASLACFARRRRALAGDGHGRSSGRCAASRRR